MIGTTPRYRLPDVPEAHRQPVCSPRLACLFAVLGASFLAAGCGERGTGPPAPGTSRDKVSTGASERQVLANERMRKSVADREKQITIEIPGSSIEFCYIPPGEFTMGSPQTEEGRDTNEPARSVKITKGFYLGKHEVTQAQYRAVLGENPSTDRGDNLPCYHLHPEHARK